MNIDQSVKINPNIWYKHFDKIVYCSGLVSLSVSVPALQLCHDSAKVVMDIM